MRRRARVLVAACSALLSWLSALPPAHAYSTGVVVPGCGCHNGGTVPEVKLLTPNNLPNPGDTITLSVVIQAVNGNTGGFFLQQTDGEGTLMPGEGSRQPMPRQVVHSAPGRASGSEVRFDVTWTAPTKPGGAYFQVYGVSANGSGAPTGDNFGSGAAGVAVGCAKADTYYYDSDKDGVGSAAMGTRPACEAILPLSGWALADGDCDENRPEVNPKMPEVCNLRDDDCDGKIDEGVENAVVYPDADEDGYGDPNGMPGENCGKRGYAPNRSDCDDRDKNKHPGNTELCNGYDDDCDGDVDEMARPSCGVGSCARRSPTCELADCSPGLAEAEYCDLLDNDCDGQVDEGLSCNQGGAAGAAGTPSATNTSTTGGAITAAPTTSAATAGGTVATPAVASSTSTGGCSLGGGGQGLTAPLLALTAGALLRRRRRIGARSHSMSEG